MIKGLLGCQQPGHLYPESPERPPGANQPLDPVSLKTLFQGTKDRQASTAMDAYGSIYLRASWRPLGISSAGLQSLQSAGGLHGVGHQQIKPRFTVDNAGRKGAGQGSKSRVINV